MPIVYYGGINEVFRLVHLANPTLPIKLNRDNAYLAKWTLNGEATTATLAGKYGSGVRGYVDVTYRRVDLAKIFAGLVPKIGLYQPLPLLDCLAEIFETTGLAFSHEDLVPVAVPTNQTFPYRVRLTATPNSPVYYGSAEVEFVAGHQLLQSIVLNHQLVVDLDAVDGNGHQRAELLSFGIDYSAQATALKNIATGSLSWTTDGDSVHQRALALAYALNAVDEYPWVATKTANAYTLYGAVVAYNGLTSQYDPNLLGVQDFRSPNTRYDRVLVLRFASDTTTATGPYGSALFVHYNTQTDNEVPHAAP